MQEQKEVLAGAQAALTDAFGPNHRHTVKVTSTPSQGLTSSDLNAIVAEVGGKSSVPSPISKVIEACNQSTETLSKKKNIAETKKLIETFAKNMESYPKHLSYEGSVVLCSLIGLKQNNNINLNGLPKSDVELIYSQIPLHTPPLSFSVELDDQQDFKLKCVEISNGLVSPETFNLRFFNSVIRPNTAPSDIPIKQEGNKVTVGTNLVLDQQRIQKLVGNTPPEKVKSEEEDMPRRQAVSGRNAFEIRTDVLTLAVDWINHSNGKRTEDEVMRVAKLFYSFVEDRNRR
jgi:hypothetical protein